MSDCFEISLLMRNMGGLRVMVTASRLTLGDVHGVASEACALPHETALLGEERGDLAADELVGDGFVGVGVELKGC